MKIKHYPIATVLIALLTLSSLYAIQTTPQLSTDRYLQHVTYLASEELKGRGTGSPELERAADYLAEQFRAMGLQPAGENGTYFQTLEVTTGTEFGSGNALQLGQTPLEYTKDFVPIAFSSDERVEGPLVFAGYGITAPDLNWDDYEGVNVRDKVVVVFRHEPQELDAGSKFSGTNFTTHASFINKAVNARQHGAKGIIFITDPVNHRNDPDVVGPATRAIEGSNAGIAAVHATQASILALFASAGRDLAAIQQEMDRTLRPASFELPAVRVRLETDVIRIRKPVRNVLASVRGSDPALRDEWVVIGAHYDHLGVGNSSSLAPSQIGQIHHGADDNASGTAGILELARLAGANREAFKRSVLFMGFTAEEAGLLGSAHFVNQPTVPMNNIIAMINLDMIGRMRNDQLFLGGVGTSPSFRQWLESAAAPLGLKLDYSNAASGGSDHMSFSQKRVPILFFFTGLHADYHRPSDTSEKINAPGAIKILQLVNDMAVRIANEPARPLYTEVREQRPQGGGGGGDGYGTYFGSVPDFRDDLNGVLFADVRPDSPAAKAGLRAGDLLTEFDGHEVKTLYDFTYALQGKRVGDTVVVKVQRNGQTVTANVTLEARR